MEILIELQNYLESSNCFHGKVKIGFIRFQSSSPEKLEIFLDKLVYLYKCNSENKLKETKAFFKSMI
jgi:hypothetical protein